MSRLATVCHCGWFCANSFLRMVEGGFLTGTIVVLQIRLWWHLISIPLDGIGPCIRSMQRGGLRSGRPGGNFGSACHGWLVREASHWSGWELSVCYLGHVDDKPESKPARWQITLKAFPVTTKKRLQISQISIWRKVRHFLGNEIPCVWFLLGVALLWRDPVKVCGLY